MSLRHMIVHIVDFFEMVFKVVLAEVGTATPLIVSFVYSFCRSLPHGWCRRSSSLDDWYFTVNASVLVHSFVLVDSFVPVFFVVLVVDLVLVVDFVLELVFILQLVFILVNVLTLVWGRNGFSGMSPVNPLANVNSRVVIIECAFIRVSWQWFSLRDSLFPVGSAPMPIEGLDASAVVVSAILFQTCSRPVVLADTVSV